MVSFNERWTIEKHQEYWDLKRKGYTKEMLKDHFGDDIYESGMYNRKSSIMPWLDFITEIIVTPEYVDYNISKMSSDIYKNKLDYIIKFEDNEVEYIIHLFYYIIDDLETYNILLTTKEQWIEYKRKLYEIRHKGYVTTVENIELVNIVEKETGLNRLYKIIKKISYILLDFSKNENIKIFSIGETDNLVKINLYRNIIKSSFNDVEELGIKLDDSGKNHFIYKISN